ncbi:hypothetical protein HDE_14289 [Halotydeus destructor]|nr:hypothetical protein HDE_14289 [Halotydeus destructor]
MSTITWSLVVALVSCLSADAYVVTSNGATGKAAVLTGPAHIGMPSACFQRVDPGPCGNDIVRIYYDHKTFTCKAFSYSGCGGNMNRFVSVKNCYKLCHPYYRQRPASVMYAPSGNETDEATTAGGATTEAGPERQQADNGTTAAASETTTAAGEATTLNANATTVESTPGGSAGGNQSAPGDGPEVEFVHHIFENEQPGYVQHMPIMGMAPMGMGMNQYPQQQQPMYGGGYGGGYPGYHQQQPGFSPMGGQQMYGKKKK